MSTLIQVALGGALGAMLRYMTLQASIHNFGPEFPYGTLIVNVAGSFAMGALAVFLFSRLGTEKYAPFVLSGLLGGFTTFSAFSLDTITLLEKGRVMAATLYTAGSVGLSITAVLLGIVMMRAVMA